MIRSLCLLLLFVLPASAETERQAIVRLDLAGKYAARAEVRTNDGARCDLVTATEAIEVDRAGKFAEGIGQALEYGLALDKKPAVLLLVRLGNAKDGRCVARAKKVCDRYKIKLYVETWQPPK